jgi:alkaline phosphatase D
MKIERRKETVMNLTLKIVVVILSIACVSAWADRSDIGNPRIMQGPMTGAVTDTTARIWVRVSGPYSCAVEYDTAYTFKDVRTSAEVAAEKANDYCITFTLTNLVPDTEYFYSVRVHDKTAAPFVGSFPYSFRTAPTPGTKRDFTVMFGSCPRFYVDRIQPIWEKIAERKPNLFLWIGDNIYGDTPDADILAEEYRRQRSLPSMAAFLQTVPQLAVWDDHDYGLNDHDRTHPWKEDSLRIFQRYWPNPAFGLPTAPGVFFRYTYGAVDFFFLDDRYYRDPNTDPDTETKTMLGKDQRRWLEEELKKSQAVFKVLVSGSGWNHSKGAGGDSWAAFLHERDAIFDFIMRENIPGVLLISGDTHVGEMNAIPWSEKGGYDFYELVSSPLAQMPSRDKKPQPAEVVLRPIYRKTPNAGVIKFEFSGEPRVILNLMDLDGNDVYSPVVVLASELKNGVASCRAKVLAE